MLNPRCPNCNYILVLLQRRQKYKCAKCSKLFPQKDIEAREFRLWDEKQKELDKHNLKVNSKKPKLTEEERKQRLSESRKKYRENNIEKIRSYDRERWHNGKRKEYSKEYYRKNLEKSRLQKRILYYRLQQKLLAQQELKINGYKPFTCGLDDSFSTFGLSDVLEK